MCGLQELGIKGGKEKQQFFGKVFAIEKLMETGSADADQTHFITCAASTDDSPEGW